MKRNIFMAIMAIVIVALGASLAQAERIINGQAAAYTAPASFQQTVPCSPGVEVKILKQLRADSKNFRSEAKKWADKGIAAEKGRTEALQTLAEVSKGSEETKRRYIETVDGFQRGLDTFGSKISDGNKNLYHVNDAIQEQNVMNTKLIIIVLIVSFVIGLAILGFVLILSNRKVVEDVKCAAKAGAIVGVNALDKRLFEELPVKVAEKTAEKMKEFNSEPFKYEAGGKSVTQGVPDEAKADNCYLLIHVPENMNGTAASYERKSEANRGIAQRNCRKTMQRYFAGEFNGPTFTLQKALIDHLISSGEIKY